MSRRFLPDVNVWLALVFDAHVHHALALAWFNSLSEGETSHFCRSTQQGFLRLANNPQVFPKDAVSTTAAWSLYDTAISHARIAFVVEPQGIEIAWRNYTHGRLFTPKLWNDAYLAAFAQIGGLEVVTFDRGFAQLSGCRMLGPGIS
jgi:toxin-antitoxin system PIN domain toxin